MSAAAAAFTALVNVHLRVIDTWGVLGGGSGVGTFLFLPLALGRWEVGGRTFSDAEGAFAAAAGLVAAAVVLLGRRLWWKRRSWW